MFLWNLLIGKRIILCTELRKSSHLSLHNLYNGQSKLGTQFLCINRKCLNVNANKYK